MVLKDSLLGRDVMSDDFYEKFFVLFFVLFLLNRQCLFLLPVGFKHCSYMLSPNWLNGGMWLKSKSLDHTWLYLLCAFMLSAVLLFSIVVSLSAYFGTACYGCEKSNGKTLNVKQKSRPDNNHAMALKRRLKVAAQVACRAVGQIYI